MQKSYRSTVWSCYLGIITQAIISNLAPLLFVIFQDRFNLSFEQVGRLILFNFSVQFVADLISVKLPDKIGIRSSFIFSHALCVVGLIGLSILPNILPSAYLGLITATVIYAFGSGMLEVLVSPTITALPGEAKASAMNMLHSFYCWGQVLVVLVTTLLIRLIGSELWYVLPILWTAIPLINMIRFFKVPLLPIVEEGKGMKTLDLLREPLFLLMLLLIMCAGAAEITMSQWASLFAERGLGVSKVAGDLLGPCLFAIFMGTGRALGGVWGEKINLKKSLTACCILCIACYLLTVFAPIPILSLTGCAVCGLSVSLMWPGVYSLCAKKFPLGGTAMFAIMAVFGDIGCSAGPWLAGIISDVAQQAGKSAQYGLKEGIFICTVFPVIMLIGLSLFRNDRQKTND